MSLGRSPRPEAISLFLFDPLCCSFLPLHRGLLEGDSRWGPLFPGCVSKSVTVPGRTAVLSKVRGLERGAESQKVMPGLLQLRRSGTPGRSASPHRLGALGTCPRWEETVGLRCQLTLGLTLWELGWRSCALHTGADPGDFIQARPVT